MMTPECLTASTRALSALAPAHAGADTALARVVMSRSRRFIQQLVQPFERSMSLVRAPRSAGRPGRLARRGGLAARRRPGPGTICGTLRRSPAPLGRMPRHDREGEQQLLLHEIAQRDAVRMRENRLALPGNATRF